MNFWQRARDCTARLCPGYTIGARLVPLKAPAERETPYIRTLQGVDHIMAIHWMLSNAPDWTDAMILMAKAKPQRSVYVVE